MKDKALEVLKKSVTVSVDIDGAAMGMYDEVLIPALEKIVADTSNPIDDMVVATLKPLLRKEFALLAEKAEDKIEEKVEEKVGDIIK